MSLFLALALLVAPSARAEPEGMQEFLAEAPNWPVHKERAKNAMAYMAANTDRKEYLREVAGILGETETFASQQRQRLSERTETLWSNRALTWDDYQASKRDIQLLFDARLLAMYGCILPAVLDEAVTDRDGHYVGRLYAGPHWNKYFDNTRAETIYRSVEERILARFPR